MQISGHIAKINQSFMDRTSDNLAKAVNEMSSGLRNQSNPSTMAIASAMTAKINGTNMASRNALDAVSMTQTAEGAMGSQISQLQEARELAVSASNGTLSDSDRASLNEQAQALISESNEVASNTSYNGKKLMDGSTNSVSIQTGANSGDMTPVALPDTTSATLGIDAIDLTTQAGATTAIEDIDKAIESLGSSMSDMSSSKAMFERRSEFNGQLAVNEERSRSRIVDTDYAKSQSEFIKDQMMNKAQIAMRSHTKMMSEQVLQLLK